MKKSFKPISFKIWCTMARFIGGLLILAFLVNYAIVRNLNDEFVFERLKEFSETVEYSRENSIPINIDGERHWIKTFKIEKNEEQWAITPNKIFKDKIDERLINKLAIEKITEKITNDVSLIQGKVYVELDSYYYFAVWDKGKQLAQVYYTTVPNVFVSWRLIGPAIFLLIISFIASRAATNRIAKPIKELEAFAGEISKRNWGAQAPEIEPDEIGLLTIALKKMRDSLKIAEDKDRRFLQSVSHDLKTPVMIIKGYSQAILDGVQVESVDSAVSVIKKESERLERRITQLLRLNTLDHTLNVNEREIIRVDRLIKSLIAKLQVIRPDLNWILNLQPVEIEGDSEALLIAFENIFENQLRYAKTTVEVTVIIDEILQVKISNDGDKFKTDNPNELFEAHKKDQDGNFGLGLAIVKRVIESHMGKIEASNIDNGVEFVISFNSYTTA